MEVVEGGGGGTVYFGLKYLTSSRLLKLQLRDPTLRLQVWYRRGRGFLTGLAAVMSVLCPLIPEPASCVFRHPAL